MAATLRLRREQRDVRMATDPAAGGPLLVADDLTVDYGSFRALDHVGLSVTAGEIVVLAGENGAGKSTLVRCLAGDVAPGAGRISVAGRRLRPTPAAAARAGIAVVWQDLSLCENLDVAANLLLGRERRFGLLSDTRFHATADEVLHRLGIPLGDSSKPVRSLSGGQRQLVAVARAMRDRPRLLILDEPTSSLGVAETAQVEALTTRLRAEGTTIVVVSHDVDQMVRLADRVVVLRHGRVVGEVEPRRAHRDDIVAVINGQAVEGSARRQLSRLHGLAGSLAQADPSSSLGLILSALVAALGAGQACIHLVDGSQLRAVAGFGLPPAVDRHLRAVPVGPAGGPLGATASSGEVVVVGDLAAPGDRSAVTDPLAAAGMRSCWCVPVPGPSATGGVVTVLGAGPGRPSRDELDLLALYAGYVASAIERDRLLAERTARNRVLEAIREVLESLAGPSPLVEGLTGALSALRDGLGAEEVGLYTVPPGGEAGAPRCRTAVGSGGVIDGERGPLAALAADVLADAPRRTGGRADRHPAGRHPVALSPLPAAATASQPAAPAVDPGLWVRFAAPGGTAALVALAVGSEAPLDRRALLDDAAHSLRLALEREGSERARQEAAALRRSKELHQQFLSRLSHELRTPLTAIHGYASSLMAADVAWDSATEDRFLARISAESARLARLVDDLLDSSAIESGTLRLQHDWCDLALVLDSARACLPLDRAAAVAITAPGLPAVWADHDRLEQVFVNLMDNAVRHNPPGTAVSVVARALGPDAVEVVVADDGGGGPRADAGPDGVAHRGPTSGSGLGLSIARGIVDAHGGHLLVDHGTIGTTASVRLPVEQAGPADG